MSLILNGTDGLSDVDGTAGTPAIRGTDSNTGVFFATDIVGLATGGTERMRIDSAGNMGIGVTPGSWSAYKALQVGLNTSLAGNTSGSVALLSSNALFDGSSFKYITTDAASQYQQNTGEHIWRTAASGSAGATLTFSERMRIDSSGNLLVGITSARSNAGDVQVSKGISFPATQSAQSDANTLDDYEEGTWTPTDSSGASLSFTNVNGYYTKIGNMVYCAFRLVYPSTANANVCQLGGLPFSTASLADSVWGGYQTYTTYTTAAIQFLPANGGTTVSFFRNGSTNGPTNAEMSGNTLRGVIIYQA